MVGCLLNNRAFRLAMPWLNIALFLAPGCLAMRLDLTMKNSASEFLVHLYASMLKACKVSRLVGVSQVCGMSVVYTGIPRGVQAEVYVSEMWPRATNVVTHAHTVAWTRASEWGDAFCLHWSGSPRTQALRGWPWDWIRGYGQGTGSSSQRLSASSQ